MNVAYPGLGFRPYHVEPMPDLDVITYNGTSSTPGKTRFNGTLSSYGGCVVLIDSGAIRLVAFERDHVNVQGHVLNLLPRFGDQVGYQVFAGDEPFGSGGRRSLGDSVEFHRHNETGRHHGPAVNLPRPRCQCQRR